MKLKTADLQGLALNYVVTQLELPKGWHIFTRGQRVYIRDTADPRVPCEYKEEGPMEYDEWAMGGPIIEREGINLSLRYASQAPYVHDTWDAVIKPEFYATGRPRSGVKQEVIQSGPLPLIAAMRCYVASKLGDEAEVPDELSN